MRSPEEKRRDMELKAVAVVAAFVIVLILAPYSL